MGLGCCRRTLLRQGYNRARETHLQGANPGLVCGQNVLVPSVSVPQPRSIKAWLVLRGWEGLVHRKEVLRTELGWECLEASLQMLSV